MSKLTRNEAQVILAGIRVLSHLREFPPTPDELADLLEKPPTLIQIQLMSLKDMGAVAMVQSAYQTHVEIRDYLKVEELDEEAGPEITEELRAFDERKKAEAEKMAHLFDSGDGEKKREEKHQKMDEELRDFKKKKPINPFGDD